MMQGGGGQGLVEGRVRRQGWRLPGQLCQAAPQPDRGTGSYFIIHCVRPSLTRSILASNLNNKVLNTKIELIYLPHLLILQFLLKMSSFHLK